MNLKGLNQMKKYIVCLLCLIFTACANTADTKEITETAALTTTASQTTTALKETSAETTSEDNEDSNKELDFWICPVPEDGYIIADPADSLTLKKLYPLICICQYYMMSSQDFSYKDNEWKRSVNYQREPIYFDDYAEEWDGKLREVFTNRLVDLIPMPDEDNYEKGYYLYSIGLLSGSADKGYTYGNDRGVDACYVTSDWQIEVVSNTEVQLIHQAYYSLYPEWTEGDEAVYFKDHKLLNQADDSVHQLRTADNRTERLETYYYTLLWEDEHWKFDSFCLWT